MRTRSPVGPLLEKGRPCQTDDEQRQVCLCAHQVIEEIQRTVIRPVNVFQENNDCFFVGDLGEELRGVVKSQIANLPRVAEDSLEMRAGRKIEADQVSDKVGI